MKVSRRDIVKFVPLTLVAALMPASTRRLGVESKPRGAAVVVAAHNSSPRNPGQVDYLCDGIADQVEIQGAIDSLPSEGGKVILLEGDFDISRAITLRNRVNLEGAGKYATRINAPGDFTAFAFEENGLVLSDMEIILGRAGQEETTLAPALKVDGLSESTFTSLRVVSRGRSSASAPEISILEVWGSTDKTVRFESCDFIIEMDSGPTYQVVYLRDSASPIFSHCLVKGSGGSRGFNIGVACSGDSAATFFDCTILGGDGGTECLGAYVLVNARPTFHSCFIKAGDGGTVATRSVVTDGAVAPVFDACLIRSGYSPYLNATAILTNHGSMPSFGNCTIQWGEEPSRGVEIGRSSSPKFNSCVISPIQHTYTWMYDSAHNGRFRPFVGKPCQLVSVQVYVIVTRPGVTVDLGTTPGGNDIASNVSQDDPEAGSMAFHRVEIDPDGYLYATPSAPVNNGDFVVYYAVVVNNADSPAIWLGSKGYPLIEGCTVIANGASNAVEVGQDSVEIKNWKIIRSHLETLDPVHQYSVSAAAPLAEAPLLLCDFAGGFHNISSLAR